jgi:hypothetical protein
MACISEPTGNVDEGSVRSTAAAGGPSTLIVALPVFASAVALITTEPTPTW